jgi:hypothetical protein
MLLANGAKRSFRLMAHVVLAAPELVRVAHDFQWLGLKALRIVHVGQTAALLARPTRASLLPVSWGARGLVPGGLALGQDEGIRMRELLGVADTNGLALDLRAWAALDPERRLVVDLRIPNVALSAAALRELTAQLAALATAPPGPGMDPGRQRAMASKLAGAIVTGDASAAEVIAGRLIGAGPGATPAGDDVIVGVLAGVRVAGNGGLLDDGARNAQRRVELWIVEHRARTTQIAAHDLAAAARGSFSEHVHDLVHALAGPDRVAPAVARSQGWGATSGLDLAHGLVAGLHAALLEHHDPHRTAA